jgi:hypothetical protein
MSSKFLTLYFNNRYNRFRVGATFRNKNNSVQNAFFEMIMIVGHVRVKYSNGSSGERAG